MSLLEIILIAIGLSMDAFAVALATGASGKASSGRAIFRISFHFGLFQFLMPILGWALGASVTELISAFDHWIAFGLLVFVGAKMILAGLGKQTETAASDPSRGITMVMLSIATSLDAFAVGLSLALVDVRILYPALLIGLITSAFSFAGMTGGAKLGLRFGKRMEIAGGIILVLIGLRILISHL